MFQYIDVADSRVVCAIIQLAVPVQHNRKYFVVTKLLPDVQTWLLC